MRIFISHSSKNKDVVLKFAEFLEEVSSDIEVFCTSEIGSISVGKDFIEEIFKELSNSDLFIAIISKEYYESKYCMIELGVAYSFLCTKYKSKEKEYIFPFALYPVQKGYALSGTPLVNIQTGDLNDEDDIHSFLKYLSSEKGLKISSGKNRGIHAFINEVDKIALRQQNVLEIAKINTYFDDSIYCEHHEDIIYHGIIKDTIVVNYNMNPYELEDVNRPNFISVVLGFVDKLDLGRFLELDLNSKLSFVITSFTNSLRRVFIEFKYSDANRILESFEIPIVYGDNDISISLEKMKSKALKSISEICFVIHPDDIVEDEGMYKISNIRIN